jgi:hypothetical protein
MVNLVHLKRNRRRYFHVGTDDAFRAIHSPSASMYETKSPPHGSERESFFESGKQGRLQSR